MARDSIDALRSLADFMVTALPDSEDWEVRLGIEEGTFKRPFCRVGFAGGQALTVGRTVTDVLRPFSVHLFPVIAPSPEYATVEAARCEDLLTNAFTRVVGLGHPARLPLWDFTGVPLDAAPADPLPVRGPNDYMRVRDATVGQAVDPDDERIIVVTASLRLAWRRSGDLIPAPTPFTGVRINREV